IDQEAGGHPAFGGGSERAAELQADVVFLVDVDLEVDKAARRIDGGEHGRKSLGAVDERLNAMAGRKASRVGGGSQGRGILELRRKLEPKATTHDLVTLHRQGASRILGVDLGR